MRLATWNLLHAIPIRGAVAGGNDESLAGRQGTSNQVPDQSDDDRSAPTREILSAQSHLLNADIVGLQEVDSGQVRSDLRNQVRDVADGLGAPYWVFVPAILGTPGQEWELSSDAHIHHHEAEQQPDGSHYGVGLVSRFPISDIEVMRFPAAPLSLPLLVPGPKGATFLKVADEPRVAIIATVNTPTGSITVATTHLSFVPGYNIKQLRQLSKRLSQLDGPVILLGDLNMPSRLPELVSKLDSLARIATYPVLKPRIQFDHILAKGLTQRQVTKAQKSARALALDLSDHCALSVELDL